MAKYWNINEDTLEKKWKHEIDLCSSVFGFPSLIVLSTLVFHGLSHIESFSECALTKMVPLVQTFSIHNNVSQNQSWRKNCRGMSKSNEGTLSLMGEEDGDKVRCIQHQDNELVWKRQIFLCDLQHGIVCD